MNEYEVNDILRWEGADGILKNKNEYFVWQIREGVRGQEFTLKHKDLWMVEPVTWWEAGDTFTFVRHSEGNEGKINPLIL
ncbi:MAG: hypothetical protein LBQ89_07905 [Treponema sp.]|nr:hypothetical protein [Treponema sp.]